MVSIFIVDDEPTLREILADIISFNGHQVLDTAKDGREAVEKYKSFMVKPDITIMDYRMPLKDGVEAAEEIMKIDPGAKIIFASADQDVKDLAFKTGAVSFKQKPFSIEYLLDNIEKAMTYSKEKVCQEISR